MGQHEAGFVNGGDETGEGAVRVCDGMEMSRRVLYRAVPS